MTFFRRIEQQNISSLKKYDCCNYIEKLMQDAYYKFNPWLQFLLNEKLCILTYFLFYFDYKNDLFY